MGHPACMLEVQRLPLGPRFPPSRKDGIIETIWGMQVITCNDRSLTLKHVSGIRVGG